MKTGNFWPPKFFFQIWLKIQPKTFKTSKFHDIWAKNQGCAPLSFISWKKSIFEKSELQRAAKPKPLDISGKNFGFRVHSLVFQHRSTKKPFLETPVYPLCKDFSDSYLQLLLTCENSQVHINYSDLVHRPLGVDNFTLLWICNYSKIFEFWEPLQVKQAG